MQPRSHPGEPRSWGGGRFLEKVIENARNRPHRASHVWLRLHRAHRSVRSIDGHRRGRHRFGEVRNAVVFRNSVRRPNAGSPRDHSVFFLMHFDASQPTLNSNLETWEER